MFEEERLDHDEMDMLTEENDIDIDDNERWTHWPRGLRAIACPTSTTV
jgi:hypothetical protein